MPPAALLDRQSVEPRLPADTLARIDSFSHAVELESTNRHLLDGPPPVHGRARVAIAEFQTAGRGRRGRSWLMPPGSGVALSVGWRFGPNRAGLEALSLAVGAAARRAIREVVGLRVGLKWPNDLIVDGAKLGGILVELAQHSADECHAVVGIGVNVDVPEEILAAASDLPGGACDLAAVAPEWPIDRVGLAAGLIAHLVELLAEFPESGFEPYRAEWRAAHVLAGETVEVSSGAGTTIGRVVDIDDDGALVVELEGGVRQRLISGDVTIRARA